MCILSYIYGRNSLELGEDIELFYVVQDFCLVTVYAGIYQPAKGMEEKGAKGSASVIMPSQVAIKE